uniref:Uncharacterized protein n=2 Tax=Clytia hemisphaerica TaxID=252671 RepID=A0A7M6DNA4_9CNID
MRIFISGLLLFILVVVTQARFVSWRDINTPKRDHVSRHAEKSAAVYPAPKLNLRVEPPSTKDKVAGISNILKGTVNGISRDTVFEVDETPSSPDQQGSDVEDPEKEILPIEANSYEPNISQKDSESEYRPTTPSAVLQLEEPLSGKSGSQNTPQPDSPTSSGNDMNRGEQKPMSSDTGANQLAPPTDIMTSENSTPILKHDDTQQTPAVRNLTNILQTYGLSEQKDSLKPKEKIKSIFTVPNKKQKVQVHVDYPKPKFLEFMNKPLSRVLAPPEHATESSVSPKNETTPDVRGAIVPKNNTESSKGRQANQTEDKAGSTRESLENWENLKDDLHYEDVDEQKKPELKKEESNQNRDGLFKQNKEDPWLKHLKVADEVEQQNDRIDNLVQQNGIGNLSALEPMQPGQFPNKLADRILEKNEEIMKLGESLFPKDDNKKKPNTKQIISQYPTPAMTFWKAPVKNSPDNRMDLLKGLGRNDVSAFANSPEIYNAKSIDTPIGSVLSPGVARFDEKSVPPIKETNTLVQNAQSSISKLMEEKNHGLNENIFGGVNSLNNLQLFKKENKAAAVKDQQKQVYQKPKPLQQSTNNVNQNQLLVNPALSVASKQSQNQNRFAQQPYQVKLPQKAVKPQSKQNQYRAQPSSKPKGPSIAVFDLAFQDPKSRIKTKTSAKATATGNAAALSTSKSDANVNGETSSSYSEKAAGLKQKVQELRHNTQRKQGSRNSYGWGNGQGYGYGKTSFGKGGGHAWAGDNYDTGLWNPGQAGYDTSGNSNHHRPQRQPSGTAGTSS